MGLTADQTHCRRRCVNLKTVETMQTEAQEKRLEEKRTGVHDLQDNTESSVTHVLRVQEMRGSKKKYLKK